MSLSIYDPVKGCFVLKQFKPETVNAFHKDFMKTHHPDFMKEFRTVKANQDERASKAPRKHVKVFTPKAPNHVNTKANQSMTMEEVKAELLKPKEYRTYSRAGVK